MAALLQNSLEVKEVIIRFPLSPERIYNNLRLYILYFSVFSASCILFTPYVGAEVVNLSPTKDTFINRGRATTSYGNRNVLRSKTTKAKETLLQFNPASIPNDALILKAELRLFSRKGKHFAPDNNVRAFANLGSWSESTTWSTRPTRASSPEDVISVINTHRYYSWDITDLVQDWKDGVETNYGVRVIGFGGGSLYFKSSEAPSRRPFLHVEYTPASYVAFGDSITRGSGDDIAEDNCSNDGRNCGGGFEPILNNRLTNTLDYDHTVLNRGVSGNKAIDGLNRVWDVISDLPRSEYFLVLFGTNDALSSPPVPSGRGLNPSSPGYAGSYKDVMQQIIDAIIEVGKTPYLAKVPYLYGSCKNSCPFANPDSAPQNILVQEYNIVIDELRAANQIIVVAPDLYNHFRNHPGQIDDDIHPNGKGYKAMAKLWRDAIISGGH